MKLLSLILILSTSIFTARAYAQDSTQALLESFHKYGITQCDSFIAKNTKLGPNWRFFISKHAGGIDGPTTEVTVRVIDGKKHDTVETIYTYVQSRKACYLLKLATLTWPGPCSDHINGNAWYITSRMPKKDYTKYANKGGVSLFAKQIKVGNFKACITEYQLRKKGRHG